MDPSKAPVLHCPTCYSTKFKLSKVRPADRLQLLIFKQPVRCRKCNARIYARRSYVKWLRRQADPALEHASVNADRSSSDFLAK